MKAVIESLDQEGRGVTHVEGKTIFIEGALPGERVEYRSFKRKPSYEFAETVRVEKESFRRTTPACPHFGVCGGCSMQHVEFSTQVAVKQRILEDNLTHIGKVTPQQWLPPVQGPVWGYRGRARLSVRYVEKKGGVLVGFHEKRSSFIADMRECRVLPPRISQLIVPLRELVFKLSIRERLPQIELAVGDAVDVLVLRVMEPLTAADEALLKAFADERKIQFWLQTKGPDTAQPFYPENAPELAYRLPEFDIYMPFKPTEFTQVNSGVNQIMVRRALKLLDVQPHEKVLDLFCGLGNFTLPIARQAASVVGVEGHAGLVARAQENAGRNGISNAFFEMANLFEATPESIAALGEFDKWLIDPPRDGAVEVVKSLPDSGAPHRIVYVSCNPATLARDAAVLTHTKGYTMRAAGILNMFPHTAHVESIAVFER